MSLLSVMHRCQAHGCTGQWANIRCRGSELEHAPWRCHGKDRWNRMHGESTNEKQRTTRSSGVTSRAHTARTTGTISAPQSHRPTPHAATPRHFLSASLYFSKRGAY